MTSAETSTTPDDKAAFLARLREYEGRDVGPPLTASDPVNEPMIHHWCDALSDDLPVYWDADLAAESVHGAVVAPPTMLQVWSMPGLRPGAESLDTEMRRLLRLLADAGFPAIIATNYEQEYHRYLRPGERTSGTTLIESISEEKATGLGAGHFVTTTSTHTDESGAAVGTTTMRVLVYAPKERPPQPTATSPDAPKRRRPMRGRDNAFFWEGVDAGELRIQRCAGCGELHHPPRPMCHACHSVEWDWVVSSGRGVVHSFVVYHRPVVPPFEEPYVVAVVELEEGTRLVTNVVGVPPGEVHIDMPVECRFDEVDEGFVLPQFYPAGSAGKGDAK